jgi:hypothetical protein
MWRASCSKRCLVRPVHVAVDTNPAGTSVSYIETEEWLRPTKGAAWHMGRTVFARKRRQQSRPRLARASAKVWPGRQRVTTGTVRRLQSQWGPVSMGQLPSCSCFHQTLKKYLQAQDRPGVGSGIVSPDASAGGRFRSGEGLRPWTSMPATRTVTKVSLVSSIVGCSLP